MGYLLRKFFKKYDELKEERKTTGGVEYDVIYINDYIDIIHDACSICYGRDCNNKTIEDKLDYVERRAKSGHESIFEHSNMITYFKCNDSLLEDVSEVLTLCKYLNTEIKIIDKEVFLLIGGSIRGYKHVVREIKNSNNKIYKALLETMYSVHSHLMYDFIEDNIMDKSKFLDIIEETNNYTKNLDHSIIRGIDPIHDVLNKLEQRGLPFAFEELLKMTTITVHFTEVSRAISQQLVRHRAGITQSSQRYVNASNNKFLSPDTFKPEKYDKDKIYEIVIKDNNFVFTLEDLGKEIFNIYPQLISQGLLKEDARSFLPMNVDSSLFMTFTLIGFIKFLELRTEKHAQAEIQIISKELEVPFMNNICNDIYSVDEIYKFLKPKYNRIEEELEMQYDSIDEVIE